MKSDEFSTNLTQAQTNRNHGLVVPVLDYSRASVSRSLDKGNAGSGNEIDFNTITRARFQQL